MLRVFKQSAEPCAESARETFSAVKKIIEDVRRRGDSALSEYEEKFGAAKRESKRLSRSEIESAKREVKPDLMEAIEFAAENIRRFAELQLSTLAHLPEREVAEGVFLGHRTIPADSCCCYVPGGRHPLFSTALMLTIPAKCAGVGRICAFTPPLKGCARPHPATVAALDIGGADEIYAAGGAQAIAAAAYGTESIEPVSLIVGPGNRYVTEAKRQVYGRVGIDFVAGPSEVLIIADGSADAEIVAADILAQSEHDTDARGILVTTSGRLAEEVAAEVERQLPALETEETARTSWERNGEIIIADSLEEAAEIANEKAPEHLEVVVRDAAVAGKLRNFGSLFIGEGSAEVFGDYVAGTNHTLPTMGAARYTGGVWVGTFLKTCTFQRVTKEGVKALAPAAAVMAENEGLDAHAQAARVRLKKLT